VKLRILTHAEKDLSRTLPDAWDKIWPEFLGHDPIVNTFWPRMFEVYPDFQLWVVDGKNTVAQACTVPVRWDGIPEPRGIDWAMTNGVAGEPSSLCAITVNILPEYRGKGLAATLLRRMAAIIGRARPR
jgi:GNAT superfamily N-acetyltransferase